MIDTHCHLLPGIDDGPESMALAVELAVQLTEQGVTQVVCTPHFSRQFPTTHAAAAAALESLRAELGRTGVPLDLHLAAEIVPERLLDEERETLQARAIGRRFVLVEVVQATPLVTLSLVREHLARLGFGTVFGHPERCAAVQRRPLALEPLREAGALVQIVAPTLLGRWGDAPRQAALELLEAGLVDLLASDAHGPVRRRPHLRAAAELVGERFGEAARTLLTETTPSRLLDDSGLTEAPPDPDRVSSEWP